MEIEKIDPKEFEIYTSRLIPRLMRVTPYQWVRIDRIAKDVERFIDICQCLSDQGYFVDPNGWPILDIYRDSLVRINPMFHKNNINYDCKIQRKKQNII